MTSARFSFDGKLLVTTGLTARSSSGKPRNGNLSKVLIVLPGEILLRAVIGPNDQFVAATPPTTGVGSSISRPDAPWRWFDTPADAITVDLHPSGDADRRLCRRNGENALIRRAVERGQRRNGCRISPSESAGHASRRTASTARARSTSQSRRSETLIRPVPGTSRTPDFGKLAKWMVTYGVERAVAAAPPGHDRIQRSVQRDTLSVRSSAPHEPLV